MQTLCVTSGDFIMFTYSVPELSLLTVLSNHSGQVGNCPLYPSVPYGYRKPLQSYRVTFSKPPTDLSHV